MIGINLKVTVDDEEIVAPITPKSAIEFERHFKMGLPKAFTTEQKMEHLFWLGWACVKATGRVVKPFDSWLEQVKNVEMVVNTDPDPFAGKE